MNQKHFLMVFKVIGSLFVAGFLLIVPATLLAGDIHGTVVDENGSALAGANVLVNETGRGAASDLSGFFDIHDVPDGSYVISASMVGYVTDEVTIEVAGNSPVEVQFVLETDWVALEELIYRAERETSHISVDEPVRTEVITAEELHENSADGGLLSALSGHTGVNTRPCALCGSAGVGMQGLDPSYTEVNIDGLPLLSGIGSLYGFDALAVNDISRVELVKGSGSSEFGSGAVAGAVNLVSAIPEDANTMTIALSGGNTLHHSFGGNLQRSIAGFSTRFSVNYAAEPSKLDRNNDQLTDTPQYHRLNLQLRASRPVGNGILLANVRTYGENRFAGDVDWTTDDRGSAKVYGRDIQTRRAEVTLRYQDSTPTWGSWSIESAYVQHMQDSWYGVTEFDATQSLGLSRFSVAREWSMNHSTLGQVMYRYEEYNDNLQLASRTDRLDRIPGLHVQHTWTPSDLFTLQGGTRLEYFEEDGAVPTIRGSLLYRPDSRWNFTFTSGTGYRPITIFSLDKAVHAGFDNVQVPASLKAESSLSNSLSAAFRSVQGSYSFMVNVTGFYTTFDNKAVLAYSDFAGETVYSNALDAFSRGVEVQTSLAMASGWQMDLGGTISDVQYRDASGWHFNHMQNKYLANLSISKEWDSPQLRVQAGANLFGPMELPDGRSRSESPVYTTIDAGITRAFGDFRVSLRGENLAGYIQPDNPFLANTSGTGSMIDSAMIYGPLIGRTFRVNLSYTIQGL